MIGADVGSKIAGGGVGLGGSGLGANSQFKPNDPHLNQTLGDVASLPKPKNETPWNNEVNAMVKLMIAAFGMIALANLLAKSKVPWVFTVAMGLAMAALAASVTILGMAVGSLILHHGQTMLGLMWSAIGAYLAMSAMKALAGGLGKHTETEANQLAKTFGGKISNFFKNNFSWLQGDDLDLKLKE
ncbi:MAG: hypothetical protein HY400_03950 [Elusimicrobia bacterium]|nr:hypothetical protein [Elusimicrobiota bacterium]